MIRITVILLAFLLLNSTQLVRAEDSFTQKNDDLSNYEKVFNECIGDDGEGNYGECFKKLFERCISEHSFSFGCLDLQLVPAGARAMSTIHVEAVATPVGAPMHAYIIKRDKRDSNVKDTGMLFDRENTTAWRWGGGIYVPTPAEQYLSGTPKLNW